MFASARWKPSCVCLQTYIVFFQRKTDIGYRLIEFSFMRYILKDVKKGYKVGWVLWLKFKKHRLQQTKYIFILQDFSEPWMNEINPKSLIVWRGYYIWSSFIENSGVSCLLLGNVSVYWSTKMFSISIYSTLFRLILFFGCLYNVQ